MSPYFKYSCRAVLPFLLLFSYAISAYCQNIDEHRARIEKIEQEIELLDKQIYSTNQKQKNTLDELVFIKRKIENRKEILKELDTQLKKLDGEIEQKDRSIKKSERELDTLERHYEHLILNTYKNRDTRVWFLYILSSKNIGQGYRRWEYLKNYADAINEQGETIKSLRKEIIAQKNNLVKLKSQTIVSQREREKEYANLLAEQKEMEGYSKRLAANQNRYKKELESKRKEVDKLNREVERLLAQAIKQQEQKSTDKEDYPVFAASTAQLTADFASNKGKLPWPVDNGVVIEKFGQHYHPLFKGVKLPFNNGINISTSAGKSVKSVFHGVISRVVIIPGYNQCVLVEHGNYFTFYCKLADVSVKVGDRVNTGDIIGTLAISNNTSTLHFELWNKTVKQDPELWLAR